MASLLDKLRAARPIYHAQSIQPASYDCYQRTVIYPCHDFPVETIGRDTLHLLMGLSDQVDIDLQKLLFLDTETTGLNGGAGTVAFLIGLGRFWDGQFIVTQYLMRDYDEEIFMLEPVLEALKACEAVVTFNGASFDMPLLQSRLIMNALHRSYEPPFNIDLLHIARRVFKLRVRPCSLVQLESEVFHHPRAAEDLPGSEVPQRYFKYIKTREMALLDDILEHNAQDVVSMARLIFALINLHKKPLTAQDERDILSLGRVFEKRGEQEQAKVCFRACGDKNTAEVALMQLAEIFRREGKYQDAADAYEKLRLAGAGGAKVYIALAKVYEHRFKAYASALAMARQGMVYCLEQPDVYGEDSPEYIDLLHRAHRLIRKIGG